MICKDDDNTYAARICNQLQITEGDITCQCLFLARKPGGLKW